MRTIIKFFLLCVIISFAPELDGQDVRTLETKVADLLVRLPAVNEEAAARLMEEMYSLGEEGWTRISEQVIEAGTGDDSRARLAIYSLSAYLSKDQDRTRKNAWENHCLRYMNSADNNDVRVFFMRQMLLIGSDAVIDSLSPHVNVDTVCNDAVMVLQSLGTQAAHELLASSLSGEKCPCAAQIMNALASESYSPALESYKIWYDKGGLAEKSSALFALANSGSPEAMPFLIKAAESAGYKWDPAGAVSSLLCFARNAGLSGDIKIMEKLTDLVISASNTAETASQRLAAMSVIAEVKGEEAMPMLLKAVEDPDLAVRLGVLRIAATIPGHSATRKWINKYKSVSPGMKAEIVYMLGERGDTLAVPLFYKALYDPYTELAVEAVSALVKVERKKAIEPVLEWIIRYDSEEGHIVAATNLTTILDKSGMEQVASRLASSNGHAAITLINLLAWSGDETWFSTVLPYCISDDTGVRSAALNALKSVSGYNDQEMLINMLNKASERPEIIELQGAVASAAWRNPVAAERSEVILASLDKGGDKMKLIPILAVTGGNHALKRTMHEFENGSAEMRDVCFDALSHWIDPSAEKALYEICTSGNKTFERPAFDAYLRTIASPELTPERRLLLVKKIAPFALTHEQRIDLIELAGRQQIYPSCFFIKGYLTDNSDAVRNAAVAVLKELNLPADEFVSLFNGRDLSGWQVTEKKVGWSVRDGLLISDGSGDNLNSEREYSDFEMYADWHSKGEGEAVICLRRTPQVMLDSIANVSGGWNNVRIQVIGDKISYWINGEPAAENALMKNKKGSGLPVPVKGPVELYAKGGEVAFRDIWIKDMPSGEYNLTREEKEQGFVALFNGHNLDGWVGDKVAHTVEDGIIVTKPGLEHAGNLYTEREYSDFIIRFDFLLSPGANNGLGIRAPLTGDAAYVAMELQIIDNTTSVFGKLEPWQFHGSVYGVLPARKGYLKPVGEWNSQEVIVHGTRVKVTLNGAVILDGDITEASEKGTADGQNHPGLKNTKGHIGFLYHDSLVKFRNIRIKELNSDSPLD